MSDAKRQTRSHLMKLFERSGLHPRSDFGQNFLIDLNVLGSMVRAAELTRDDVVLEVGTGTGALTVLLAEHAGSVITVERDTKMAEMAQPAIAGIENIELLRGDALKNKNHFHPRLIEAVDRALEESAERRLKLVANLPYQIATPVISNLLGQSWPYSRMVATIQFELAQRMIARPGTANYGTFSVWMQSQAEVKLLRRLGPQVFWPRPQVSSAIVSVCPAPERAAAIGEKRFFQDFLRRLFGQRRKLMRGVIAGMYRKRLGKTDVEAILEEMGFAPTARAEELPPAELVRLANRVQAATNPRS